MLVLPFRLRQSSKPDFGCTATPAGQVHRFLAIDTGMAVIATIMNTATGQPIQKMTFGRMPKPWASFNLATGELVTADRVEVGKPAPGKVVVPVAVWVTVKAQG